MQGSRNCNTLCHKATRSASCISPRHMYVRKRCLSLKRCFMRKGLGRAWETFYSAQCAQYGELLKPLLSVGQARRKNAGWQSPAG